MGEEWAVRLVPFCSVPFRSVPICTPFFSHVHALSLVSPFVEYSEHPEGKIALHISLNSCQKLTSKLHAFMTSQCLSNFPLSSSRSTTISLVL